jgi:hypothetical protein
MVAQELQLQLAAHLLLMLAAAEVELSKAELLELLTVVEAQQERLALIIVALMELPIQVVVEVVVLTNHHQFQTVVMVVQELLL